MHSTAIPVGNFENKYESANPLARYLVDRFLNAFDDLVVRAQPESVLEAGCGEGALMRRLENTGAQKIKGVDIAADVFAKAQRELDPSRYSFEEKSIYDLTTAEDGADTIICCEVLEHVDDPESALAALHALKARRYILSVSREPLWRVLNMARLKYLGDFGNTPGHLNHWSQRGFQKFVSSRFEILELRAPLPWTMVLCAPR